MGILPTFDGLLQVFVSYNTDIWPMQIVAYGLGVVALIFGVSSTRYSSRMVAGVLTFFWLWTGLVFSTLYFPRAMPVALVFAPMFVAEGVIIALSGVFRRGLSFGFKPGLYGALGWLFVLYAMVGYPAIEYLLGRGYPRLLAFGLADCPTTVFTSGLLLWTDRRVPKYVLVIPLIWSLSAVLPVYLGIVEDVGLFVSGVAATAMILYRDRRAEGE
jgi:hypothetical protein